MITDEQEKMIVAALQTIVRNDTTRYEHHEARRWDGLTPREAGKDSTRWLEPGEIARGVLRRIGAPVPDSIQEMVERQKPREAATP